MKVPNIFVPEKDFEAEIKGLLEEKIISPTDAIRHGELEVIHDITFAKGITRLKWQCGKPFTFYENIIARIKDYESNGKNSKLFKIGLDSVTGIAYKAKSTKFKLILRSDKLENIKQDLDQEFDQEFIPVTYNLEQGIELDRAKGKYNKLLTKKEVKNHEFWLIVMNNDKERLAEYVDLWFDKTKAKKGMGVYLRKNTNQDELFALSLGDDTYLNSNANGNFFLYSTVNLLSFA